MNFPGTGAGEFESKIDSIAVQVSVWLGEGGGGEMGAMTSFVSAPAHSMCDTGKEIIMFEMEFCNNYAENEQHRLIN